METKREKKTIRGVKKQTRGGTEGKRRGEVERERPERMERRRKRLEETLLRSAGPKTLKQKDHLWGEEEEGGQNRGMKAGGRLHGGM